MRAGKYRHRVLVEQPTSLQDEAGAQIPGWSLVGNGKFWASIAPLRGDEKLRAGQILAQEITRICFRWHPLLDAMAETWRITHRATIYNVSDSAHIDMARKEIEVMASSGANLG